MDHCRLTPNVDVTWPAMWALLALKRDLQTFIETNLKFQTASQFLTRVGHKHIFGGMSSGKLYYILASGTCRPTGIGYLCTEYTEQESLNKT